MSDLKWSPSEKRIARAAFDRALKLKFDQVMADFKVKAAAATIPTDMWAVEEFLREQRREIDEVFDYRYSQLRLVFARLIRTGLMREDELAGLSEDKLEGIRRLLSWYQQDAAGWKA